MNFFKILCYSFLIFFPLSPADTGVQTSEINLEPLIELTQKFNDLEENARSLSKELKEFKGSNLGVELKLKYDYFFNFTEKLFKTQSDLADKSDVKESDCKFEELEKSLNSLRLLIDCWHLATLKLQILDLYLFSHNKNFSDQDLLNIKLNIFDFLFSNLSDIKKDKNKYVSNVIRKFIPKNVFSTWLKSNDIAYHLLEIDLDHEEELLNTYEELGQVLQGQDLEKLNTLWIDIENQINEIRIYLFKNWDYLEEREKQNLGLVKIIFEALQIKIVKSLIEESEISSKDGKKETDIKIKFEGIDPELVSKVVKKLLAELGPVNLTKIILAGAWEKLTSLFVFSG